MNIINILIAILVFGIVVFIHELGHFILAKVNNVTVEEFSIGMGPLITQKKYKDTNYSLRLIPMGGYVAMAGEDDESEDPNAFSKKSPLARMSIVFAGPFMNFVLTIITFILVFSLSGIPVNKIGGIIDGSPASKVNLKIGDEIKKINGINIENWQDIPETVITSEGNLDLLIIRGSKKLNIEIDPTENNGKRSIGIYPLYEKNIAKSIKFSFENTYIISVKMLDFLGKMVTGKVNFNYVSGPVGIVREMGKSVDQGFSTVLMYIAFISLNLGIMNLLPIPALDGFRFLTAFIELITKKKLSKQFEAYINYSGFILLIALMIFVTYKDILKIFM